MTSKADFGRKRTSKSKKFFVCFFKGSSLSWCKIIDQAINFWKFPISFFTTTLWWLVLKMKTSYRAACSFCPMTIRWFFTKRTAINLSHPKLKIQLASEIMMKSIL